MNPLRGEIYIGFPWDGTDDEKPVIINSM